MLENLRRKSLSKTYIDSTHHIRFEQGHAIYLNSYSIAQHGQKLSKQQQTKPFPNTLFETSSKKFRGFSDTLGNVKFNMIFCPSGTFTMGHKDNTNNQPRKETIEKPFLLGETEVTQELYEKVEGSGYNFSRYKNSKNPIDSIRWESAISFCNKLSRLQGLDECYTENPESRGCGWDNDWLWDRSKNGYRLPTEKEWEYAAKAGTNNRWAGTDNVAELGKYAWFEGNLTEAGETSHPVASKLPNEWGFYDMSGNVWELCWDLYSSGQRVLRGGGWWNPESFLRSTTRNGIPPQNTNVNIGFRVCRHFNFEDL